MIHSYFYFLLCVNRGRPGINLQEFYHESRSLLGYLTLLYSTLLYATPRHATPRHATPRHATPRHATLLYSNLLSVGGAVASWLVRSTPERAVQVRALAWDIVLCSWVRHLASPDLSTSLHTAPLSAQVYKWVRRMLGVTLR